MTPFPSYLKRALIGALAAFAIGFSVVGVCNLGWSVSRGVPIKTPWDDASLPLVLFASAPYLALAVAGVIARRPWIAGLIMTVAFWGLYLFEITRPYEGGGANIGLALLMMLSPIMVIGASVIAALTSKTTNEASQ